MPYSIDTPYLALSHPHLHMPYDQEDTKPLAPRLWKQAPVLNYCLAIIIVVIILMSLVIFSENCRHWVLLPIGICSVLTCVDFIRWFRGEIDVFDPKFIVSVYLFIHVVLAPLLHLYYNIYAGDLYVPDWPQWMGYMGLFNVGGIIGYKATQRLFYNRTKSARTYWYVEPGRIFTITVPILFISLAANLVIQFVFGGLVKVMGEIQISSAAGGYIGHLSWLRMLGDPIVPLFMMTVICWLHINKPHRSRSTITVLMLLLTTAILQFLSVGLRGSRSIILMGVLTVTIIVHYTVRPIPRKLILIGMALTVVFLYLYDFRKKAGLEGWQAFYNAEVRQDLAHDRGDVGMHTTIMADLARADVQAQMLYNITANDETINYDYRWGKTYAMSILTFVPRAVWPNKPNNIKNKAGAEILYGYKYSDGSTRQYGLAGEAMMNFGYWAILPVFILFGLFVGVSRKKILSLFPGDGRLFLAPILLIMLQSMVISDSGNWMFQLIRDMTLPFIVFFFGCKRELLTYRDQGDNI